MGRSLAPGSIEDLIERKKGGRWSLNDRHEVQYRAEDSGSTTRIKTSILDVRPAALVLQYTQETDDDKVVTRIYELEGTWRADPKNRITFVVEKKSGVNDVLTFRNIWTVNKNHEIEYSFEETAFKTREKVAKKLVFRGFWDLSERSRFTYWLGRNSDASFRFRGAFQTTSILAKKEEIRYQVGVEVDQKIRTRTVTLFGKWKYSRKYGLSFDVDYRDGRRRAIRLGADYSPTPRARFELDLVNTEGKPLGAQLILTRDFLNKDGQSFVKLLRNAEESRIEAGALFSW